MKGLDQWNGRNVSPVWMDPVLRRMDRLFQDVTSELMDVSSGNKELTSVFVPPCDLQEREDGYLLSMDLPGVKRENINIEVLGNSLVVSAERNNEQKVESKGRSYRERHFGRIERRFVLTDGMDTEKISAHYEDGELSLLIPKIAQQGRRKIEIRSSGPQIEAENTSQPKQGEKKVH